jgi:hypothetical protein
MIEPPAARFTTAPYTIGMIRVTISAAVGIVALIATVQPVQAASSCKTWDDISTRCILDHPESPFVQGYVAGIRDGMFMQPNMITVDGVTYSLLTFGILGKACLPIKLSFGYEMLVASVRDYLRTQPPNPEAWSFGSLLSKSLSQTFPCPSSLGQ